MQVRFAQRGRHCFKLVRDGREDQLQRFDRVQAVLRAERVQRAIDVLRVRVARVERDPKLRGFLAEAADGVDLAVVAEQSEGLDALEARDRVGGVARVAQRHRGVVAAILQVRVIAHQHLD